MDYFQGVVTEFLRADRGMFVNTECLIQLDKGDVLAKGRHWYCDAVAVSFREEQVFLCEVTYAKSLQSLVARLTSWAMHWHELCAALVRDCGVPENWKVQPWIFIPEEHRDTYNRKILGIPNPHSVLWLVDPKVTFLEDVTPWKYPTWNRKVAATESKAQTEPA